MKTAPVLAGIEVPPLSLLLFSPSGSSRLLGREAQRAFHHFSGVTWTGSLDQLGGRSVRRPTCSCWLDRQGAEHLDAFEQRGAADAEVQQLWRVSPGPDFVLVVHCADMPGYQALAQRLFTQDANVRNVKACFSVKRAKFDPRIVLRG